MKLKKEIISLLVICTGFLVLSFFLKNYVPFFIAAAVCAPGFLWPAWAEIIHTGWMKLALVLGWINTRLLLFIIFFFILTPVALLARLFGKTAFQKSSKNKTSQFINRNHLFQKTDFENPW